MPNFGCPVGWFNEPYALDVTSKIKGVERDDADFFWPVDSGSARSVRMTVRNAATGSSTGSNGEGRGGRQPAAPRSFLVSQ